MANKTFLPLGSFCQSREHTHKYTDSTATECERIAMHSGLGVMEGLGLFTTRHIPTPQHFEDGIQWVEKVKHLWVTCVRHKSTMKIGIKRG